MKKQYFLLYYYKQFFNPFLGRPTNEFKFFIGIRHRSGTGQVTEPIVRIQDGRLRGSVGKNLDGDDFLQFLGVPYGKAPVGELRFKPPQPVEPWKDIKDATKVGSASISRDDLTKEVVGSEDCLYLNIYTRNLQNSHSKHTPVMVYFHGGALTWGSSRPGIYGPQFLMIKDIVLVTLNYRLGILGLLAFDDPTLKVTGNMGFKDQNMALKWVQRNIIHFNGDPNNVTIFGESAGSGSVHAHILSHASKGLFHKAILQSGCALNSRFWGSKNNGSKILKQLGKYAATEQEALEILQGLPGREIFRAQDEMSSSPYPAHRRNFGAVLETPNDAEFISNSPMEILNQGLYNKVPIMIGYTQTEGMEYDLFNSFKGGRESAKLPEFDMKNFIPCELDVANKTSDIKKICDILDKVYSNESDAHHYDEMTDSYFLAGIMETINNHLKTSETPIYLYRMSLVGQLNYMKRLVNRLDEPGVCHCDDLGYLFHSDITPKIEPGSLEDRSVRIFVELWTNFAKYGNPTPDDNLDVMWEPVKNIEKISLLDIGKKLAFKEIPERDRVTAWLDVFKNWPLVKFN